MKNPTPQFEAEVTEIITDQWLDFWDQETMMKSDAESHSIGCLVTEVRRLRRNAESHETELHYHYSNWKMMGKIAGLCNFLACILTPLVFQSPLFPTIVFCCSILALWTCVCAFLAESLNKSEFKKLR